MPSPAKTGGKLRHTRHNTDVQLFQVQLIKRYLFLEARPRASYFLPLGGSCLTSLEASDTLSNCESRLTLNGLITGASRARLYR